MLHNIGNLMAVRLSVPGSRASRLPRGQDGRTTSESIPSSFLSPVFPATQGILSGFVTGSIRYGDGKGIYLSLPFLKGDNSPHIAVEKTTVIACLFFR